MPLPKPTLDNRSFDQLVAEGRGQIPRLAPAWTDHNASDPGITLLELAAWLTEQNLYRLDRPSDEALRTFVRLAGVEPRAPGVARTVVALDDPNGAGMTLPARIQLASQDAERFETTEALFVSPAKLVTSAAGFGERPRSGATFFLGFDRALDAPGQTLSLHVWTETWEADLATREALIAEHEALLERLMRTCPCETWKAAAAALDWRRHYRASTVWEYHSGSGVWTPLADVIDETRALSLSGFVRFTAPTAHQPGPGAGQEFFIRCRIRRGRFECPPRLQAVAINAVGAEHALSRSERQLGVARGHAHAVFAFDTQPVSVVAGQTRLRLDDGLGDVQADWREVLEWDRSGPHARHFKVTPERGELQGGDGLRAAVLPDRYAVHVSYREGGGEAGNIAAKTLVRVPPNAANVALSPALAGLAQPLAVLQPCAATGGAPREDLRAAQRRAYEAATRVDKAVTVGDFERIARATPGVPVARVHAVPGLYPHLPCYPAPGIVTLIVVPRCRRPAPMPSRALLEAVSKYLEPRRLVTTEVHVVPPSYRRIAVHATLQLGCDAVPEEVLTRAAARLDGFLDPLDGGPDGDGWPAGRTVYRSELMALLAGIEGVLRVTGFSLQGQCDNVTLCPHELAAPGRHRLRATPLLPRDFKRSDAHECEPC